MNSKFFLILSAVVVSLIATAPLSHAVRYTPSNFNAVLKAKVGSKTGPRAYSAAASLYKKALGDRRNKKYADRYARSLVNLLKKTNVVRIPLQGQSVNTLVKALLSGYFKHRTFDLNNRTFNKALDRLIKSLRLPSKTASTSQAIYYSIQTYAVAKGGATDEEVYQYFSGVAAKFLLPPPPVS